MVSDEANTILKQYLAILCFNIKQYYALTKATTYSSTHSSAEKRPFLLHPKQRHPQPPTHAKNPAENHYAIRR